MNNPIRLIDPDGMSSGDPNSDEGQVDAQYSYLDNQKAEQQAKDDAKNAAVSQAISIGFAVAGVPSGGNQQGNGESATLDEPPINLYKGISLPGSMFNQAAENQPYTNGDGKFYIYGHGNTEGVEYFAENENASFSFAFTPEKINVLLATRSPEWKKAMAERKKITAIFYACQVGATEVIGTGGKLETRIPIAQEFSKKYPNVTVIAPNGYLVFLQTFRQGTSTSAVVAIHPARGEGQWITYRNGKIVNKEKFTKGKEPSVAN